MSICACTSHNYKICSRNTCSWGQSSLNSWLKEDKIILFHMQPNKSSTRLMTIYEHVAPNQMLKNIHVLHIPDITLNDHGANALLKNSNSYKKILINFYNKFINIIVVIIIIIIVNINSNWTEWSTVQGVIM